MNQIIDRIGGKKARGNAHNNGKNMGMINTACCSSLSLELTSHGYDQPVKDQTLGVRTADLRDMIRTRSPTLLLQCVHGGLRLDSPRSRS